MAHEDEMPSGPGVTTRIAEWVDEFLREHFNLSAHESIPEGMDRAINNSCVEHFRPRMLMLMESSKDGDSVTAAMGVVVHNFNYACARHPKKS